MAPFLPASESVRYSGPYAYSFQTTSNHLPVAGSRPRRLRSASMCAAMAARFLPASAPYAHSGSAMRPWVFVHPVGACACPNPRHRPTRTAERAAVQPELLQDVVQRPRREPHLLTGGLEMRRPTERGGEPREAIKVLRRREPVCAAPARRDRARTPDAGPRGSARTGRSTRGGSFLGAPDQS